MEAILKAPYKEGDTEWEDEYTKVVCSIERDIFIRMGCNEPINQRTIDICNNFVLNGVKCPFLKTQRPKRKQPKNQTTLFTKGENDEK